MAAVPGLGLRLVLALGSAFGLGSGELLGLGLLALLGAAPAGLGCLFFAFRLHHLALDNDAQAGLVLLVEADKYLVVADALDGVSRHLDSLAVDLDALLEQLVAHGMAGDRSIELAVGPGGEDDDDLIGLDPLLEAG